MTGNLTDDLLVPVDETVCNESITVTTVSQKERGDWMNQKVFGSKRGEVTTQHDS